GHDPLPRRVPFEAVGLALEAPLLLLAEPVEAGAADPFRDEVVSRGVLPAAAFAAHRPPPARAPPRRGDSCLQRRPDRAAGRSAGRLALPRRGPTPGGRPSSGPRLDQPVARFRCQVEAVNDP